MDSHSDALRSLASELMDASILASLNQVVANRPLDFDALVTLDSSLGWACVTTVSVGGTGTYHLDDRDVFRPLQYAAQYMRMMAKNSRAEWLTRQTVHMASLHLEHLVQRIGLTRRLPLGRAIREKLFLERVDETTWEQLDRFREIYNAAKHDMSHAKDTHMFSESDAVVAYFVCRSMGNRLAPMARLKTAWAQAGLSSKG